MASSHTRRRTRRQAGPKMHDLPSRIRGAPHPRQPTPPWGPSGGAFGDARGLAARLAIRPSNASPDPERPRRTEVGRRARTLGGGALRRGPNRRPRTAARRRGARTRRAATCMDSATGLQMWGPGATLRPRGPGLAAGPGLLRVPTIPISEGGARRPRPVQADSEGMAGLVSERGKPEGLLSSRVDSEGAL